MSVPVIITVSQLNKYIKSLLDSDSNLQTLFVSGEISNFVNHRSGHFYLTLKDSRSEIKAVMFRSANSRLKFLPENGMKVICRGHISVYEAGGTCQLYIDDMQPDGIGALNLAFEQLKEKLKNKGMFDEEIKKDIPKYPSKVGVITSPTGAAVQDIRNVLSRRYPLAEMVLYPVLVQGEGAAQDIAKAIKYMNENKCADVLIVGRGGGSIEDLWAFNEETVANAVFESGIPVISAVGHETDFTICDFVADLRAPTPSAAAELAVPDSFALRQHINSKRNIINSSAYNYLINLKNEFSLLSGRLEQRSPALFISDYRIRCDKATSELDHLIKSAVREKRSRFAAVCSGLDAMSPLKILGRGFVSVTKNGKSVTSSGDAESGDVLNLRFADGQVDCTVN